MHPENGSKKQESARLSRGCAMVLWYLKNSKGLHSAREIHDVLRQDFDHDAPGLTTVYRSLETLLKLELVQAIALGQGEKSYEFIEPGEHHHHLICTSCSESIHLDQCFVDDMSSRIEGHHGFKVRTHVLELFGLCPACQKL